MFPFGLGCLEVCSTLGGRERHSIPESRSCCGRNVTIGKKGYVMRYKSLMSAFVLGAFLHFGLPNAFAACGDSVPHACFFGPNQYTCVPNSIDCRGGQFASNHQFCSGMTDPRGCPTQVSTIQADWCTAGPVINDIYKGNVTGLTAQRAGRSCTTIPAGISRIRVWCYVFIENRPPPAPNRDGYCVGYGDSSCGPVGYIERQHFRSTRNADGSHQVCVDVNNQHSNETRHFAITAAPN